MSLLSRGGDDDHGDDHDVDDDGKDDDDEVFDHLKHCQVRLTNSLNL